MRLGEMFDKSEHEIAFFIELSLFYLWEKKFEGKNAHKNLL